MDLFQIPGRVFLDSSTLQTLQDYGEYMMVERPHKMIGFGQYKNEQAINP